MLPERGSARTRLPSPMCDNGGSNYPGASASRERSTEEPVAESKSQDALTMSLEYCLRLSTPCSVGTATPSDATCICRMFRPRAGRAAYCCLVRLRGNRISGRVDGSLVAGHSRSSLPQRRSNFAHRTARYLATKHHCIGKSMK